MFMSTNSHLESHLHVQAIAIWMIHSLHLPYFLQITHYKRATNSAGMSLRAGYRRISPPKRDLNAG